MAGFRRTLESDLAALGFGLGDVEAVILTHSDADHAGLVGALHEGGARILIHAADEPKLRKPGPKSGDARPINMVFELWRPSLWRALGSMALSAKPTRFDRAETFDDARVLDVPGHPRVIPTPGHTPGHCAVHFERPSALFVDDAMCWLDPITGRKGPQAVAPRPQRVQRGGAALAGAIEAVEADILLFGHGEPWRGDVAAAVARARPGRYA